jgi:hypothetical protein
MSVDIVVLDSMMDRHVFLPRSGKGRAIFWLGVLEWVSCFCSLVRRSVEMLGVSMGAFVVKPDNVFYMDPRLF